MAQHMLHVINAQWVASDLHLDHLIIGVGDSLWCSEEIVENL